MVGSDSDPGPTFWESRQSEHRTQLKYTCLLLARLAQETVQSMGPERFCFSTVAKETCTLLYCLLIEMKWIFPGQVT